MKLIPLTRGLFVQVDDIDYVSLSKYKWYAQKCKYTFYATRVYYVGMKQIRIYMHREIMQTPDNMKCDHWDHNGLNCQRHNLRNASHAENARNRISHGKSKYKGVSFDRGKAQVHISIKGKLKNLGRFNNEVEAACTYDLAAVRYHGSFANLNFPEKTEEYKLLISQGNEKG